MPVKFLRAELELVALSSRREDSRFRLEQGPKTRPRGLDPVSLRFAALASSQGLFRALELRQIGRQGSNGLCRFTPNFDHLSVAAVERKSVGLEGDVARRLLHRDIKLVIPGRKRDLRGTFPIMDCNLVFQHVYRDVGIVDFNDDLSLVGSDSDQLVPNAR